MFSGEDWRKRMRSTAEHFQLGTERMTEAHSRRLPAEPAEVVFDRKTISDVGTYEQPNQPAEGLQTVLVNGGFVVQNGELILDAPQGQPMRRAVTRQ